MFLRKLLKGLGKLIILYIKTLGFVCLFVCLSELIEELASRRDMKIGM